MNKSVNIAVVGLGTVFPGAFDIDQFWANIVARKSMINTLSSRRAGISIGHLMSSAAVPDRCFHFSAGLIADYNFDTDRLGSDTALDWIHDCDPFFQWAIDACLQAFNACNTAEIDRQRISCIIAAIALPTLTTSRLARNIFEPELERLVFRSTDFAEANRLNIVASISSRVTSMPAALCSRALGIKGGSYTLDAACASSLYAVKLGCDLLARKKNDLVLVGGVSGPDPVYTQIGFSQLRALSPSGRCAPFDKSADGLVVGEGAGILALKRLEDAQAHGDTIYGIIRSVGLSNDTRGNLLAPDTEGQLRAMEQAYKEAGWKPHDIQYIECHGAGTPVGDATEAKSLVELWGVSGWNPGQCRIGSVKSMIGHLLTAAGAAGMIKTLLALHNATLPPSLNFSQFAPASPLNNSPFMVQTTAEPWSVVTGQVRRAAVSAFGFGGINAHLLLEQYREDESSRKKAAIPLPEATESISLINTADKEYNDLAIIGMDIVLGTIDGLENFSRIIFENHKFYNNQGDARTQHLWQATGIKTAAAISELEIVSGYFSIPPNEIKDILPQQLLMLKVAAGALRDANLPLRQTRTSMGAVIGISFDFESTNFHLRWALPDLVDGWLKKHSCRLSSKQRKELIKKLETTVGYPLTSSRTLGALGGIVASRIAREFRFGGPSFVISAEEASGLRALETAALFLENELVDTMLVGAVDLFCDLRNIAALDQRLSFTRSSTIRPFDSAADGSLPADGAVALVVKRLEKALADGDRIYAIVRGLGYACGRGIQRAVPEQDTYLSSMRHCFEDAGIDPSSISLFECHGSGRPEEDALEMAVLKQFFSSRRPAKPIALGSAKAAVGHTGAASGLVSVVKASLNLYHRILSPLPAYEKPANNQVQAANFHIPRFATYWPRNKKDGPRLACVASMTSDACCMHLILAQPPENQAVPATPLLVHPSDTGQNAPEPFLIIVNGNSRRQLADKLKRISARLSSATSPLKVIQELVGPASQDTDNKAGHTISLVASGPKEFLGVIKQGISALENSNHHMFTDQPAGFCFLDQPDRHPGKLAFVYPGSGNHYLSMGRRLGICWPEILAQMESETESFYDQLLPEVYFPWNIRWDGDWRGRAMTRLESDPLHMIFGQVLFGGIMTRLMQKIGIRPAAVIPYSLGESAGLFAMGAWPDRAEMLSRLSASNLFTTELYGPCRAVRQAWKIPDDMPLQWTVAHVMCPAARVDEIIDNEPYVRRLIINTPQECVIGGLEKEVKKAIEALGCEAFFLQGVVAVHCDAARPVARAYKELHRFHTRKVPAVDFYSCAWASTYDLTAENAAESILRQATDGFDFTRTIEQAYQDGIRIFVEMGPGNSCTRMISQILAGRPHLAVAANRRNQDERLCLLKCAGTLAAAGIDINTELLNLKLSAPASGMQNQAGPKIMVSVGQLRDLKIEALSPASTGTCPVKASTAELPPHTKPAARTRPNFTCQQQPGRSLPAADFRKRLLEDFSSSSAATAEAHRRFLDLSASIADMITRAYVTAPALQAPAGGKIAAQREDIAFDRHLCLEFATGSVAKVLGPEFAVVDTYPVRVRLPAEPLMLVDRILEVKGEKLSLGSGQVVTEHDVGEDAWYLDGGRAPVCIAVEAGQADLFLCSYLGIDHQVQGKRAYRLLDAKVRFHRGLPRPGETIRYHINIDKFVRQEQTWLFFFRFKGFIGSEPLITMTGGCAGFFTAEEVKASGGIILTAEEKQFTPGKVTGGFEPLVTMERQGLDDAQVQALRRGDLEACFGSRFEGICLENALVLPSGRLKLVDRVLELDPCGGRFGLGSIVAEADIHPDDWFLTCHFPDDMVMPGTLMYECCCHTLRIFLLRLGWVTDSRQVALEPVPETRAVLKCRGPVTPDTSRVHYQVDIKEIGYNPEPYVLAEAHMYADGHHIVYFQDMSLKMTGCDRQQLEQFWQKHNQARSANRPVPARRRPLYDYDKILEFAVGSPSKAFGAPYQVFDSQRVIARLPGPPYCFLHRIIETEPKPWELKPGGWITAQYDMRSDDWYFAADRSGFMPYCVLLEIALQPCGWLAAYLGSALHSKQDLKFRNLGGQARIHHRLGPQNRTLTMRSRMTKVNQAADMIIEHFDFQVLAGDTLVFEGDTYFGFFTAQALENQVGLRGIRPESFRPDKKRLDRSLNAHLAADPPFDPYKAAGLKPPPDWDLPAAALLMIDEIETYLPDGGPAGLGYLRAVKTVDPGHWFFKAHFYQDPVCPGSLGIESFIQLIKFWIKRNWPHLDRTHRPALAAGRNHQWSYRGQIIPSNRLVTVEAVITSVQQGEQPAVFADGWLQVDGRFIYEMKGFGIQMLKK